MDMILNGTLIFMAGMIAGILSMIARDAWDERQEDLAELDD